MNNAIEMQNAQHYDDYGRNTKDEHVWVRPVASALTCENSRFWKDIEKHELKESRTVDLFVKPETECNHPGNSVFVFN